MQAFLQDAITYKKNREDKQAREFQAFAGSFLNHLTEANMKSTQESFRKRFFLPAFGDNPRVP